MTRHDRTDLLVDDLDDDLPPHLRTLLGDHTTGPALSAAAERRLLARVTLTVGAAAVIGAGTAASTATATATASSSVASTGTAAAPAAAAAAAPASSMGAFTSAVVFKVAVGAMVVVGVVASVAVGGAALTARDQPQTVVTTTASTATAAPAPAAPAAPLVLSPSPSPPPVVETQGVAAANDVSVRAPIRTRRAAAVEPTHHPVIEPHVAVDEVAALAVVRDTLAAGNAQQTLRLLDDLDHDAPSTRFAQERLALRVIALSRAGLLDDATSLSATFFARFPDSMLTARVQAALSSAAH